MSHPEVHRRIVSLERVRVPGAGTFYLGNFTSSRSPLSGNDLSFTFPECAQIWGVKICIQHQGTRKFLRGMDSWVDSTESARLFENSMEALRHCVNHPVGQVNIIIDRGLARPPIIIAVEGAQAPIQIDPVPLSAAA